MNTHKIQNIIDEVKTKLTDEEYRQLCQETKKFHEQKQQDGIRHVRITLIRPYVDGFNLAVGHFKDIVELDTPWSEERLREVQHTIQEMGYAKLDRQALSYHQKYYSINTSGNPLTFPRKQVCLEKRQREEEDEEDEHDENYRGGYCPCRNCETHIVSLEDRDLLIVKIDRIEPASEL